MIFKSYFNFFHYNLSLYASNWLIIACISAFGSCSYMVTNAIEKKLTYISGNIEQKNNIRKQLCQIRVEWIEDTE